MRVGLASFSPGTTGIRRAALCTARALETLYGQQNFRTFGVISRDQNQQRLSPFARTIWSATLCSIVTVPILERRLGISVLHDFDGSCVPLVESGVPYVLSVNDMVPCVSPSLSSRSTRMHFSLVVSRTSRRAEAIVCPSRFTANLVAKLWRIRSDRIHVVPYGGDHMLGLGSQVRAGLRSRGVRSPYLLSVGALVHRKNPLGLVRAFANAQLRGHQLVIVGNGPISQDELLHEARRAGREEGILILPTATDREVAGLYQGASLLVIPSYHEGFAFPAVEAMSFGVPIVYADNSALPEVIDSAGVPVDVRDEAEFARVLHDVALDQERLRQLGAESLRRSHLFEWRQTAAKLYQLYDVLSKTSG